MTRRATVLVLAALSVLGIAAAPGETPAPLPVVEPTGSTTADPVTPFPLGACVYVRPYDPDRRYCVIIQDPR